MRVHWAACLLVVENPHSLLAPNGHRGMGRWSGVQSEGSWCARQRYGLDPACSKWSKSSASRAGLFRNSQPTIVSNPVALP